MKLFDAHCHLQAPELFPTLGNVVEHAVAADVDQMVCCGTSPSDWERVLAISKDFPQVIPMLGIHPWFVTDGWKTDFQRLETLLCEYPDAGLGETGLDFQSRFKNREVQEVCFAAHLDLARKLNRPVAVHCVRAWGRLLETLRVHPAPHIQLHAFGGSVELIAELTRMNCWFSFCGSVTNPHAKRVRTAAEAVPAERLLIETDAPDFPPQKTTSPNEPGNVKKIADAVAALRGTTVEKVAELTFENSRRFFCG